jgi:peptidylprolyl isomerase
MKYLLLIGGLCAALAIAGCGGGSTEAARSSSAAAGTTADARGASDAGASDSPVTQAAGVRERPKVHIPPGPPPKKLVVRSLKEGSGAGARWGQRLRVQYVGLSYKTGKPFEDRWGKSGPFTFNFGIGEVRKGWEIGLKGMKVGGRRELILPSRLAYGTGALLYVVELLKIENY